MRDGMEQLVNIAPVAMAIARASDGVLLHANTKFGELFSVDAKALIGTPVGDFFGEETRALVGETLKRDAALENYELCVKHGDRAKCWMACDAVQSTIDGLEVVVCCFHDIDARKRAELEQQVALKKMAEFMQGMKDSREQLFYAQKMAALGSLIAGLAHEIRTPLAAISSTRDTLTRAIEKLCKVLRADAPELLENNRKLGSALKVLEQSDTTIESATTRVIGIVKRLHGFARCDGNEWSKADLHAGLDETLMLLEHELKGRIQLVKNYGEIPFVNCNVGQINQVFLNVLLNASHAIEKSGSITITTTKQQDSVVIEITDDGSGMTEEVRIKLFQPGFTTKGVGVGSGLGMPICKKIIGFHGGSIEIDSEVGRGTTVRLTLPTDASQSADGIA